jgi:hypothetical protein
MFTFAPLGLGLGLGPWFCFVICDHSPEKGNQGGPERERENTEARP